MLIKEKLPHGHIYPQITQAPINYFDFLSFFRTKLGTDKTGTKLAETKLDKTGWTKLGGTKLGTDGTKLGRDKTGGQNWGRDKTGDRRDVHQFPFVEKLGIFRLSRG
jgi:hypothetical protein